MVSDSDLIFRRSLLGYEQYDKYLSDLLNKHAPKKNIYVVDRPLNEWMTDGILTLKTIRRKSESNLAENSYYNKL